MPSLQKRMAVRARADQRAGGVELGDAGIKPPTSGDDGVMDLSAGLSSAPFMARNLGNHLAVLPIASIIALYVIVIVLGVRHPFSLAVLTFAFAFTLVAVLLFRYEITGPREPLTALIICFVVASVAGVAALLIASSAATATAATAARTGSQPPPPLRS